MKNFIQIPLISMAGVFMLSGCGGLIDSVGNGVGNVVAGMTNTMIVCSLSGGGSYFQQGMDLEILAEDNSNILSQIKEKNISSKEEFWTKLNPETRTQLRKWTQDGFKRNAFTGVSLEDFADALASGYTRAALDKMEYGKYVFYKQLGKKEDGVTQVYYAKLNIKVLGSASNETGTFGLCTYIP